MGFASLGFSVGFADVFALWMYVSFCVVYFCGFVCNKFNSLN